MKEDNALLIDEGTSLLYYLIRNIVPLKLLLFLHLS
jgi:hypothetical protein